MYGVYAHEEGNNHWVQYFSINLESDSVCEKTDDKLLKTVLFFPVHELTRTIKRLESSFMFRKYRIIIIIIFFLALGSEKKSFYCFKYLK